MRGVFRRLVDRGRAAAAETTAFGRLLVVLGLSGFAVSQPLLAILGEEPTWFTFRGAQRGQIILFAVVVAFVPSLVLWGVGLALGAVRRSLGWWFHVLVVAGLAGLTVVQWVKQGWLPRPAVMALAGLVGGVGFAVAYVVVDAVRLWSRFTAVLPVLAVGGFLFMSPTSDLITAASGEAVAPVQGGEDLPSVLFLMLDELPTQSILGPDGGIDAVRFPNLAELASQSTWYRGYTSTSHRTNSAVPSILSGLEPTADAPTFANHPDNLFTLLDPTHDLRVVETATALCPPSACAPLDGAEGSVLRTLLGDAAEVWRNRVDLSGTEEVLLDDFQLSLESSASGEPRDLFGPQQLLVRPVHQARHVASIEPVEDPTLWYLHLTLPHQPWLLYPDGTEYQADATPPDRNNQLGPWIAGVQEQRHLLQAQYTDALVGESLDALKSAGMYDDTIIVVTADHGISFVPDTPWRDPVEANVDSQAYVPLLIKEVGQRDAAIDDSNTIAYDLLPTLAEHVGVETTWEHPGFPMGSDAQQQRDGRKVMYDFGRGFTARLQGSVEFDHPERAPTGSNRWIGWIDEGDDPAAGLFDTIGLRDVVGRGLDDLVTRSVDGDATVSELSTFTDPDPSAVAPGTVSVELRDVAVEDDDRVLMVFDDTVVSASALVQPGPFQPVTAVFLLPPGVFDSGGQDVAVAIWRDGQALRLLG